MRNACAVTIVPSVSVPLDTAQTQKCASNCEACFSWWMPSADASMCWSAGVWIDNLRHLVTMLEDLQHVGVAFVSLGEGIDCVSVWRGENAAEALGATACQGNGCRSRRHSALSVREAASRLGVSKSIVAKWRLSTRVA